MIRAVLLTVAASAGLLAQQPGDAAVRAVLDEQMRAWNRGDLTAFVRTYAPDAVFVGNEITRGSAQLLERYRQRYPTRERMGTLDFSGIEVRLLGQDFASVIGRYRLDRPPAAGGPAQGKFTLLLKRSGTTWAIILDHTS